MRISDWSSDVCSSDLLGDMSMIRGNRAIRDHALDGKDLLIFEKAGSGAPVHFLGIFACAGWEVEQQPDTVGTMRDAIVFTLVPIDTDIGNAAKARDEISSLGLNELRERAYDADRPGQQDDGYGTNIGSRPGRERGCEHG